VQSQTDFLLTQRPIADPDKPSRRVAERCVRIRIIEYLELASSFEAQQEYERDVPVAHVPYEIINQWEDWVHKDPREDRDFSDVYDTPKLLRCASSMLGGRTRLRRSRTTTRRCLRFRR
jgi:hypothetical protein